MVDTAAPATSRSGLVIYQINMWSSPYITDRAGRGDKHMPLEMRGACERCGNALSPEGEAYICSFECTFCATCTHDLQAICSNCGGELLRRPRRVKAPISSSATEQAD
jgi:hypothetical protein